MTKKASKGKRDISIWKFIITYLILMGLFMTLVGLESIKKIMDINGLYTSMIIYFTELFLKPFGIIQGVSGSVINVKGMSMDVRFGCKIYMVGVLSFPATVRKKTVGVIGGFLVLQVLNILRIGLLGLSGVYLAEYFKFIHIYVAQGMMIAIALIIFLVWLNYAVKE
ncbi:MAG: hypothetical protein JRH00_15625 [Deltaproteobacteria bacterium]|nr:hypothetical protein [Deltaproteobacteria bacterium]